MFHDFPAWHSNANWLGTHKHLSIHTDWTNWQLFHVQQSCSTIRIMMQIGKSLNRSWVYRLEGHDEDNKRNWINHSHCEARNPWCFEHFDETSKLDDTGYILSAAFIFSTAGLLSKLSHSCPLLQLQRRTSLHHCKHKAAYHGAMACSHVAGASRKYDAELRYATVLRGMHMPCVADKGSVASVTRSKRPRAGSSHGRASSLLFHPSPCQNLHWRNFTQAVRHLAWTKTCPQDAHVRLCDSLHVHLMTRSVWMDQNDPDWTSSDPRFLDALLKYLDAKGKQRSVAFNEGDTAKPEFSAKSTYILCILQSIWKQITIWVNIETKYIRYHIVTKYPEQKITFSKASAVKLLQHPDRESNRYVVLWESVIFSAFGQAVSISCDPILSKQTYMPLPTAAVP